MASFLSFFFFFNYVKRTLNFSSNQNEEKKFHLIFKSNVHLKTHVLGAVLQLAPCGAKDIILLFIALFPAASIRMKEINITGSKKRAAATCCNLTKNYDLIKFKYS